jgi:hypothetical protein
MKDLASTREIEVIYRGPSTLAAPRQIVEPLNGKGLRFPDDLAGVGTVHAYIKSEPEKKSGARAISRPRI